MSGFSKELQGDRADVKRVEKTDAEWRKELSDEQYYIMRLKGTERPFSGQYFDFYGKGHYVCAACNLKLFDSESKFSSGCGWPSFSEKINEGAVKYIKDDTHGMQRTEVQCAACDAHLGHVFNDGPPPTDLRYCINSVSVKFVQEQ